MKPKVYLMGPLLTRSGYGEQSRFALRALKTRDDIFDLYVEPLEWGHTSWLAEDTEEKRYIDFLIEKTAAFLQSGQRPDISIQCTIPNEWKPQLAAVNIGYTAGIETTKVAHEWIQAANKMTKVIVVSEHSKKVFENSHYVGTNEATGEKVELKTTVPISSVGYPVKNYDELPELDLSEIKTDFNFLAVAQWGPRKNIENMINWYFQEFHDENVGFVIKTNRAKNSLIDREYCDGLLKKIAALHPEAKCKIYLLHGEMSDEEMHALYVHEKISAFVAIPHGEGFGLPIFESAYSGLPIVAVGWSGQVDYLYSDNVANFYEVSYDLRPVQQESVWDGVIVADSMWAFAREDSYKQSMRNCYDDICSNQGVAKKACENAVQLKEKFSDEQMYKKFIDSLQLNIEELEKSVNWSKEISQIEIL